MNRKPLTPKYRLAWLLAGMAVWAGSAGPTWAQDGSFLESLFRSIAEKKLQEAQSRGVNPRIAPGQPPGFPGGVPGGAPAVQPGGFPSGPLGGPLGPAPIPTPRSTTRPIGSPNQPFQTNRGGDRTIRTSSPEVRELAEQLIQMDRELNELLRSLQMMSRTDNGVRVLLPEVYQVQAQTRALLEQCNGARSLATLIEPYQSLDQRWRELSFQVRSLPNRSNELRDIVARCDQTGRRMSRRCGVTPQFDRHALHDQMIVGATYMQALLDDLETARIPSDQARTLVRQGRLLRQAILEEAHRVETVQYDEIVTRFTEFVARWQAYASELMVLRDPMLDRRLQRISECGDQTYALLWMPPPARLNGWAGNGQTPLGNNSGGFGMNGQSLLGEAAALEDAADYFRADLRRYTRYLTPASYQRELTAGAEELHALASQLHSDLDSRQPLARLQRTAARLAELWEDLSDEIGHIDSHGLNDRRAEALRGQFDQMLPMVASLTAAFLSSQP